MTASLGFVLFGGAHLVTIAVILSLAVGGWHAARADTEHRLVLPFAVFLIAHEIFKLWLYVGQDGQRLAECLPLDLCRINALLCAYMLVRRSYRVFEVSYFWAMAGSVSAILTPDLQVGFPDIRYLSFFVGHATGILAVVYAISGFGFRPRLRSLGIALLVTAAYATAMSVVNLLLDSNYLFLRAKPEAPSVLDLLGPWPQYLLGLVTIALLSCGACYLPFAVIARYRRSA